MSGLTLGSLFDGIGVFPLAASRCGIRPLWASEIEAAPISITRRHFPDMAHLGDITKLDGGAIPPVHVLTFGSPCQNLSQIGRREGLDGAKSGLFFHAIRIIQEMRKATNDLYPVTPMGRAMLNICIVFAQLERESIQMRVQDAFYSRCTKGYYMRGRTPYGFDTEPIVMDGIKTKKLVENAEMDFAELMYQMYAEPSSSYGDITRYFVKNSIDVYGKALQRAFISKLLRNPVYVQADMDIYEYFKAQGVKIESPPEMFTGDNSCYLYQGREGEEQILVIAPHQGRIPSSLWLTVQRKLSQNTSFQNGRKCHNTWLAGKIKCGRCGYALVGLRAQNGVTYLRCKQRADNGSCEGAGTLTAQSMESFVYGEMVEKMRKYHTLKGGKEPGYNPKLTAARVALAKTESEIEKLLDTLSGANPLLLQYANNRIEELDAERQKQLKLVADLTANSVSDTQIDCITNYLNDWESVSFDDKRKVVDILIFHIDATSESVTIHWKI